LPYASSNHRQLQKAIELHRQSQFDQAVKLYYQIFEIDPHYEDAIHLAGAVAHQLGNYTDAVLLIRSAIEVNFKVFNFYTNLANSLKALNLLEEEVFSYDSAIALKQDFAVAFFYRYYILQIIGQLQSADYSYRMAVKYDPSFAWAYANLGLVLQELKEPKEAIASYEKAITLNPDLVEPYFNRGTTNHELQQFELTQSTDKLKLLKDKIQRNRLTTALFDSFANTRQNESAYLDKYRRC
jgi:protein O-GlcNAc transferase